MSVPEDTAKTMPVCFRFLLGSCFNEQCPYPHVNVNPRAPVCQAFLNGYCPEGSACKQLHTFECQTWVRTGDCTDPHCLFKHPQNVRGRLRTPGLEPTPRNTSPPSSPPPRALLAPMNDKRPPSTGNDDNEEQANERGFGWARYQASSPEVDNEEEDEEDDDDDASDHDSGAEDHDQQREAKRRRRTREEKEEWPSVLSGPILPKFGAPAASDE